MLKYSLNNMPVLMVTCVNGDCIGGRGGAHTDGRVILGTHFSIFVHVFHILIRWQTGGCEV